jgi:hypothetical protein
MLLHFERQAFVKAVPRRLDYAPWFLKDIIRRRANIRKQQGHSNSLTHDSPRALVKHHYHASLWPSRHPRYSHPAYGMVEECNWNPECVSAWDANTAAFPSLPEDEKAKLIAAHETALREKDDKEAAEKAAAEKEEADKKEAELLEACAEKLRGWKLPTQEANTQSAETTTTTSTAETTSTQPADATQTQPSEATQTQPGDTTQTKSGQAHSIHTDPR